MDTSLTTEIWNQITTYVSSLDWTYIITFIIISYGFKSQQSKRRNKTNNPCQIQNQIPCCHHWITLRSSSLPLSEVIN